MGIPLAPAAATIAPAEVPQNRSKLFFTGPASFSSSSSRITLYSAWKPPPLIDRIFI